MNTLKNILKRAAYPPDTDGANMGTFTNAFSVNPVSPQLTKAPAPITPPRPVAPRVPAAYPPDADGANMGAFKTPFSVKAGSALELYKKAYGPTQVGDSPYTGPWNGVDLESEVPAGDGTEMRRNFTPSETPGVRAHMERNAGKYTRGALGGIAGGLIGSLFGGDAALKGALIGAGAGTTLGAVQDSRAKDEYLKKVLPTYTSELNRLRAAALRNGEVAPNHLRWGDPTSYID
jgi:hypothetical protein